MPITYRKLTPGDSGQYRKIRLESLKTHPESFGATYDEEKVQPKLRFEKAIDQPVDGRFMMGAFDQDELIGIFGFVPFTLGDMLDLRHAGTLVQMYVRSTFSGQKVGLNLTKAVIREAFSSSDINQIVLGVREGNIFAIRVYEQAGFEIVHSNKEGINSRHDGFQVMIIHRDNLKPG